MIKEPSPEKPLRPTGYQIRITGLIHDFDGTHEGVMIIANYSLPEEYRLSSTPLRVPSVQRRTAPRVESILIKLGTKRGA